MYFKNLIFFLNFIIPIIGIPLFRKKDRTIIVLLSCLLFPIAYFVITKEITLSLLYFFTPFITTVWYIFILSIYIKDLKREPELPSPGHNTFPKPSKEDWLFMILVFILPFLSNAILY